MLSLLGRPVRLCDGLTRREVLRVGGLGVSGLLWSDLLRARAAAARPARASASLNPKNSRASEVSKLGPANLSQLLSACLVQRIAVALPALWR